MAGVIANPESLRQLRGDIDRSQREIANAMSRVRSSLQRTEWRDGVRAQFEKELEQTLKSLVSFNQNADQMKNYLERKARELDVYLGRG